MLNLHAMWMRSRANGPGMRTVIWFQGCPLNCAGCFNPATHSIKPRQLMAEATLVEQIRARRDTIEGITLSGGEPMVQAEGLLSVLTGIRAATSLSVVLFSGYTKQEIIRMALGQAVLDHVDVLIAGRYDASRHLARGLRGSSNQTIHLLTDRYTLADIDRTPPTEIRLDTNGNITITGIAPPPDFPHQ